MGRRILDRKGLRADFDAAERQKTEGEEVEEKDEDEEDEDEDEDEEGEEAEEAEEAEGDEEEPEVVKKKKKPAPKAPKPAKAKAKPRSRSAKVTRMKVVWGVFNNSNVRVAVYDYPKRKEADEHAAKLTAEKKQTFFVQPVKEAFEEKAAT